MVKKLKKFIFLSSDKSILLWYFYVDICSIERPFISGMKRSVNMNAIAINTTKKGNFPKNKIM